MTDAATQRAEEIFIAALERDAAAERAAFVQEACAGDAVLLRAVEQMLATHATAEKFFSTGSPAGISAAQLSTALAQVPGFRDAAQINLSPEEELGKKIGPYKLLQKIGEGGCGNVFMAEQEFPVRRRVALKVIKLGMDTKSVIARFEAERQALALMDHPNIARVLDAGATETGRPFFVMELVRGVKITTYCDEKNLEPRHRLDLFLQVCYAIQHAHQKGIIHRDIKPSNVLVTQQDGGAIPKVIDFGIAKATSGQQLTEKTLFTAFEQFVGTPAYMSPEQAEFSSLDVDTRSDIYSLGVLLYELLTGKTPFDQLELLASGLDEMRRTLRECEPHRPSTKLDGLRAEELTQTALQRHVEPRRLKSLLSGDLDWIVMKALEKDRRRRYQTANGLAADVQRYLNNEPVVARPPSRSYRLQKLVRRNRATFTAIGAVSVALIVGLAVSSWLFVRERAARWEAEQARQNEMQLRTDAEARARIAQAAVLLNRGKAEAADQLVAKISIPATEPSLEAAYVFRTLGDFNVMQGRWDRAAERLLNLVRANQLDKTDMTDDATRELLRVGPALLMAGKEASYREFVVETTTRFAHTENPIAAEHVLKVGLVGPLDAAAFRPMIPLAAVVERSIKSPDSSREAYMVAWRVFALALFEYRHGNFESAVIWARKCLGYNDATPTRLAMAHTVLAMALRRTGQGPEADRQLAEAWQVLAAKFPNGVVRITEAGGDAPGFWHDWIMAHLLFREAEQSAATVAK